MDYRIPYIYRAMLVDKCEITESYNQNLDSIAEAIYESLNKAFLELSSKPIIVPTIMSKGIVYK